jgi:hypothetical protein
MTPHNIAGMAALAGLNIVALTDHNSCRNCPAFYAAARKQGIIPIAGMELTTAEDIHLVCLFEQLEDALRFGEEVDTKRIRFPNRVDIYGEQSVYDENDQIVDTEHDLLSNATRITVDEAPAMVARHRGICYPAHVDREANGIISTLGTFPDTPPFAIAELHNGEKREEYLERYPILREKRIVVSSDAHYLWDIRDKAHFFELEDTPYSSDNVRHSLFALLGGTQP